MFCTSACHGKWVTTTGAWRTRCELPEDHPVRLLIKQDDEAARAQRDADRRWPASHVSFPTCCVCGAVFATPYTVSTCSSTCAKIKRRVDKREAEHRHRARKRGAFVSPVVRQDIHERDRWRCQICRKQVRRDLVVPHPRAPTLDHIIPLAEGGTHEPANVWTACFLCNATKGNRGGGEQLPLFG